MLYITLASPDPEEITRVNHIIIPLLAAAGIKHVLRNIETREISLEEAA